MNKNNINILYKNGYLTSLDVHFARFIARLCKNEDPDILLAASLLSNAAGNGDGYLDLETVAEKSIMIDSNGKSLVTCPNLFEWLQKLRQNPAIGRPGDFRPLILDKKNRLYLYRYWSMKKSFQTRF